MSAPASTQRTARSMAASRPSMASASVRAMMTKPGSVRASTAALMRSTISSLETSSLPGRWPQRLAPTWSSMCIAAAPALISDRVGARDVEGARAEAGVDVDQQRQVADVGDAADVDQHVVEVGDAEVRHAERAGGDAAAREVDRAVADALRQQRVVGVDRADDLERFFLPTALRGTSGPRSCRELTSRCRALRAVPSASRRCACG